MSKKLRKTLLIAAVLCFAVSISAFATSRGIAMLRSSQSYHSDRISTFSELYKLEDTAGFDIHCVEQFANGYRYKSAETMATDALDEDGLVAYSYKELVVSYERDGDKVSLYACDAAYADSEADPAPTESRTLSGISADYYCYTYKFVPPDYQPTEEDEAFEADPYCTISYGNDKIEVTQMNMLHWTQDGVAYMLLDDGGDLDADALFRMAETLIGAQ